MLCQVRPSGKWDCQGSELRSSTADIEIFPTRKLRVTPWNARVPYFMWHKLCPNWYTKSRLSYFSFHLNQWKWPLRDLKWPDLKNYDKFDISNTIQLVKTPMIDQWMINESMMLIQIEFILTGLRSQILHFVHNHFIWFTSY